jgi:Ti-type conjugative transfer relaxase TraA
MAIFHFSAQIISRAAGRSAVAAAAYRAGERLHDERLDRDHDFRARSGVEHSEILLPEGAPEQLSDRQTLWNAVEAVEKRKDAQLAREIEFAIPREMNKAQGIALARDFVSAQFVARGMIADLNVHWDIGSDGEARPHAHVMLSMREVGPDGFGRKVREWNAHENVERWRESWASHVNQRLAELDIDARIDHRSLGDQGIDLDPQSKIGGPAHRMDAQGLEADRAEMHREIARENGDRIIADPNIALDAITHGQASFTRRDLAMFLHRHSDGQEQFNAAMEAVRTAPNLIALGRDGRGEDRFTTRQMIETEHRLYQAAERMAERTHHQVRQKDRDVALAHAAERGLALSGEQRDAFDHVTNPQGLSLVIGYAGTGKSAMLGIARQAWEEAGFEVRGAALAGIAAEGLENGSGITSRTIASLEHGWARGRDLLTDRDILVIDEAGMVGTRQMERVLSHAASAGAKVVLVGDPQQLQSIEAGAAFRALHERHGGVEITQVRRQHARWQQDATRHLATGRTGEAIAAYADKAMVHPAETREDARRDLVARWDRDRQADPQASRIILTHTNAEVRDLNLAAREAMRAAGALGRDVQVRTERGDRLFASGDRIMFLRNERSLEVKNGTPGTIEQVSEGHMLVRTDDARAIAFDMKDYHHFDHGYAATIHKAQGMTVDRAHVLATPGMDRHGAYVALSRHRDGVDLHYGGDDFRDQARLVRILARERTKDMASDHDGGQAPRDDATMQARAFAERRGIDWRALAVDLVRSGARKARGLFDGLRTALRNQSRDGEMEPQAAPGPAASPSPSRRGAFDGFRPDMPPIRMADTARSDPEGEKRLAVQRHARAVASIWKMQDQGLPLLPHQRTELDKARSGLNRTVQYGASDMERAYQREPALVSDAADGRVRDALQAMRTEGDIRRDPHLRADRFVEGWQQLGLHREELQRDGDWRGAREIGERMAGMAKGLQRDQILERVLGGRREELGIDGESGRSLAQELSRSIGIEREAPRDRGIDR